MTAPKLNKPKPHVGPDGLTKQQRYRLRQDLQREMEEAGLGIRTDGLVRNQNFDLKSRVYETESKKWAHEAEDILDNMSTIANMKTGWTADQPYEGSHWEEEINGHLKKGFDMHYKMRILLRDLAPEIAHFEESETRWMMLQNAIETLIRYIAELESFQFSLLEI